MQKLRKGQVFRITYEGKFCLVGTRRQCEVRVPNAIPVQVNWDENDIRFIVVIDVPAQLTEKGSPETVARLYNPKSRSFGEVGSSMVMTYVDLKFTPDTA